MKISGIEKDGVCSEFDIAAGDELIEINGKRNLDCLDYLFYNSEENFTISIKKPDGEIIDYEIEKNTEEDLGLNFVDFEIKPKRCKNKCIFCFVDQLPKNMRKPLYLKDDDYRLSFISGNYITMTNLNECDVLRIIEQNLSPLYFSVHSVDRDIRKRLLGLQAYDNLEELIGRFSKAGITMHCQIVVCPGINDGADLIKSVNSLSKYYPNVKSVAVVPVGLTRHRQSLEKIMPVEEILAKETIKEIEKLENVFLKKFNDPFVFLSDEFYIKACLKIPPSDFYKEFSQIENGIGLIAKFKEEFMQALHEVKAKKVKNKYCIITGKSAEEFIKNLINEFDIKFNSKPDVIAVENNFFGNTVTVSGLLTGADIISQFNNQKYDKILLPKCLTKEFEDILLDDTTVKDLEKALNSKISLVEIDGGKFLEELIS